MFRSIHMCLFAIAVALLVIVMGCGEAAHDAPGKGGQNGGAAAADAEQTVSLGSLLREINSAPADAAVREFLAPLRWSTYLFFALAIPCLLLRSWVTAGAMVATGLSINIFGAHFVAHPWTMLILFVLIVAVCLYGVVDAWLAKRACDKAEKVIDVTTMVTENLPEGEAIKLGIVHEGPEVEDMVRSVVGASKKRLRAAGKIKPKAASA